ncbi:LytR C-terminal domain-containing protein [Amycolatopsis sp. NBC_01488]|uniref:LytR C-terminal domain-containing protein n=1 Tax=Amycolatopsis sp. NBC_01488 TaxID=2903563 RepID=UPI002E283854|nr:LytR C-terminal domain-containing protein [Amycolatopsis sp. NBC_01488]
MSVFSGMSRPMKAAGVALIGVAIIAAVIGGISALNGGGSNEAGPSGTPTQPGTSGGPSTPPTTSSSPSTPPTSTSTSPASPSPTTPPPGQPTSPAPGQPGDHQAGNKWVTVRVFNNSLIKDLAQRAADDFRGGGWTVNEVGNYSQGTIPTTTAFYRLGTDEEAAAKQLAQEFGIKAEPRFPGIESASPGVIVIVTKEYESGHKGS